MKHCSSQKEELMSKVGIDLTCLRTVNKARMAGAQRLGGKGIFLVGGRQAQDYEGFEQNKGLAFVLWVMGPLEGFKQINGIFCCKGLF